MALRDPQTVPGALVATAALFLPTSLLTLFVAHGWGRLRGRPWAGAIEHALPPLAVGLLAAGVFTVGRSAVTDLRRAVLAAAAALLLARRWMPAVAVVLAAGVVSWLVAA